MAVVAVVAIGGNRWQSRRVQLFAGMRVIYSERGYWSQGSAFMTRAGRTGGRWNNVQRQFAAIPVRAGRAGGTPGRVRTGVGSASGGQARADGDPGGAGRRQTTPCRAPAAGPGVHPVADTDSAPAGRHDDRLPGPRLLEWEPR